MGELSRGRRAAVSAETELPVARHRADQSVWGHLTDTIVGGIGDEQIAKRVHSNARWTGELRGSRRAAVSAETELSVARHRADQSVWGHLTDTMAGGIGDEQIAKRVHSNARWTGELRGSRRAAVSAETELSVARHRADQSVW